MQHAAIQTACRNGFPAAPSWRSASHRFTAPVCRGGYECQPVLAVALTGGDRARAAPDLTETQQDEGCPPVAQHGQSLQYRQLESIEVTAAAAHLQLLYLNDVRVEGSNS